MTCSVCGGPLDHDVTHTQHKVACHAIKADGWPATARYFGPSNHAQWCRQEHDGPCLDVLLHNIFGDGCDCPEVCADCCTDPDCALREPQETTMSDHLLERIDDWSDAVDTGHELCGRDLLYETWRLVEQVCRERDAAHETIRNALVQISEALGLPLTEAGRPRANSFLYREIGRFIECHDWDWPPASPVPDAPTPTGQT